MKNLIKLKNNINFSISIKLKITLWYSFFIIGITAISLIFLFSSANKMTTSIIRAKLVSSIDRASSHIDYDKDNLKISPKIKNIEDSIILIYDNDNNLIYGNASPTLVNKDFKPKEFQTITTENNKFYIYDDYVPLKDHNRVGIRAVMPLNSAQIVNNSLLKLAIFAFPFLIVLSAFGGYLITKKAFMPISQITDSANKISEGNDLSQKIILYESDSKRDEIYNLAETFNNMFERLYKSFEKEKQFTSDASHELRTPVSVILSQSEYLLSLCNTDEEKKCVEVILKQSKKMSKLISELLMISRMDNNKQKFNFESFNISELIILVIEELDYMSKEKNITFLTDVEDNLYLYADETMIMTVLINLITNAIKYGRDNGHIKISLHSTTNSTLYTKSNFINVNYDNIYSNNIIRNNNNNNNYKHTCTDPYSTPNNNLKGNHIIVKVSDDGIGIAKNDLDKIWHRFYQVDPAKTASNISSGLGLSIVKSIVESHNGIISVTSSLGKGSEFTIII